MAVKLSQGMRLQQKMAPQLIYSLQLLQMSSLELEQLIRQELLLNPVLEELEEQIEREEIDQEMDSEEDETSTEEEIDWESYFDDGFELVYSDTPHEYDPDPGLDLEPRENRETAPPSLVEHLIAQLHLATESEQEWMVGEYIIGNIDEDGYLTVSVEEMAEYLNVSVEEVENVLRVIQQFDPIGVGARSLTECLTIQLEEMGYDKDTIEMQVVKQYLDDFLRKRYKVMSEALHVESDELQMAIDAISKLNIKPATNFYETNSNAGEVEEVLGQITPDIIVEKVDDEYVVQLNDSFIPSLRVSPAYRTMLRQPDQVGEEARQYIIGRFNEARWLLNSIEQRRSTILKVANYIVQAQRDFFERGVAYLRPMILREVADAVGLHVATISRVTNGKYMQTPYGVFELKYFFDGKVGVSSGEDVSTRAVKERIRQFISEEDPKNPLTDEQITKFLNMEGIDIARRTVAKYREQLEISPVKYRKKI